MRADLSMTFQTMTANSKPTPGKKQVHAVQLTLEEVFFGCLKRVSFQRRRIAASGDMEVEVREVTIDVKPGAPEGTCFVFEGCAILSVRPLLHDSASYNEGI